MKSFRRLKDVEKRWKIDVIRLLYTRRTKNINNGYDGM